MVDAWMQSTTLECLTCVAEIFLASDGEIVDPRHT